MKFTDAVKTILAESTVSMTPQEIREAIKKDYPQFFGTPAQLRTVEKKQCNSLDNALLSQIYGLTGANKAFICDKTIKPIQVRLAEPYSSAESLHYLQNHQTPQKPLKNNSKPEKPTPQLLLEYLDRWIQLENYTLQEASLGLLFKELCPENKLIEHILLKVSALNDFYSTNIFDTFTVAKHILTHNIDNHLQNENHEIVNIIAATTIGGKVKNFYSFASKYCSHHRPDAFPIYDSFVEKMLLHYKKEDRFFGFEKIDLKSYSKFIAIINRFRQFYGLQEFSLRQVDIYLWLAGKEYFPKSY